MPEKEKQEMVDIYIGKGVSREDAERVVELLWPHKEAYLGSSLSPPPALLLLANYSPTQTS